MPAAIQRQRCALLRLPKLLASTLCGQGNTSCSLIRRRHHPPWLQKTPSWIRLSPLPSSLRIPVAFFLGQVSSSCHNAIRLSWRRNWPASICSLVGDCSLEWESAILNQNFARSAYHLRIVARGPRSTWPPCVRFGVSRNPPTKENLSRLLTFRHTHNEMCAL